jgi:hypothetical protein
MIILQNKKTGTVFLRRCRFLCSKVRPMRDHLKWFNVVCARDASLWARRFQQPVLLELVLQRPAADAQRAGGLLAVAGDMRQRLADQQLLHLRQRRARPHREGRGVAVVLAQEIRQCSPDLHLAAGNDHALDDVAELAHVARPRKALAELQRLGGHPLAPPLVLGRELLEEPLDQQRNVLRPLPQRRHDNRHNLQAVEQVLAELPLPPPPPGASCSWPR